MKTHVILLAPVLLALASCGAQSSLSQASASQKFQDGIYYKPQAESLVKQAEQLAVVDNLIDRTKSSQIYIKSAGKVDTLFVPDNMNATFQFNHADSTTTITLAGTDWREQWLDYRWSYSSWAPYAYAPAWSHRLWYYNVWSRGFYDPFWYDPIWGPCWSIGFGPFWADPFYYGWYDPWFGSYWYNPYWYGGYYGYGYIGGGGMHRYHGILSSRAAGISSGGSSRAGVPRVANNSSKRISVASAAAPGSAGSSRLRSADRPITSASRTGSSTASGVPSRTAYSSAARSSSTGVSAPSAGRSSSAASSSSTYRRASSGSYSQSASSSRASTGSYSPSRSSSTGYSSPSRSSGSSSSSSYSGGSHSSGGGSYSSGGGSHSSGGYSGGGASHGGRH